MENEEKQRQRLDKTKEIKETGTLNLNGNGHKANITASDDHLERLKGMRLFRTQKPPNMSI